MKENTYSLSWFKKRTAQINRELRSTTYQGKRVTYSPTGEWREYHSQMAKYGRPSTFVAIYGGKGDERSAKGRAEVAAGISEKLEWVWRPFANANNVAAAILDHVNQPGVVINSNTLRVFRSYVGDDGKVHYIQLLDHGHERPARGGPGQVVPLDNTTSSRALAKKAKQVKERTSRTHSGGGAGGAVGGYQDL